MARKGSKQHTALKRRLLNINDLVQNNLLTFVIIMGVVLGLISGIIIRASLTNVVSATTAKYVGFPGQVLIRMLKFVCSPLIVTCIICALGGMNIVVSRVIGWQIVVVLFAMKAICVTIAMILTTAIRPGKGGSTHDGEDGAVLEHTTIPDIFLDMFRNIIPNNLVNIFIQQFNTKLLQPEEYTDNYLVWPFEPSYLDSSNLLGSICMAVIIGICLTLMKVKGEEALVFTKALYEVSMKVTTWILWTSPPFLFLLIMTEIVLIGDMSIYFSTWGLFIIADLIAVIVVIFVVNPILLYVFTRTNPFIFYTDMLGAYFTAFGTSSSLATMPVLMDCLTKHGVDERLVRFLVPILLNINKDGSSIYLSVSGLFASQLMDAKLGAGQYVSIFVLSTVGSIATAGVPFAGPLILLMMLNALGLDQNILATFLALDWLVDRGTTLANIVSNSIFVRALEKWNYNLLKDLT